MSKSKHKSHKKKGKSVKIDMTKERLWQVISAILLISLLLMWFAWNNQETSQPKQQTTPQTITPLITDDPDKIRQQIKTENDPFVGNPNAPVTIVEFSDFQCPFCKRAFQEVIGPLKEEYVKTGKVKFVYKNFPLANVHPEALPAALAASCADDQGKFWDFHDAIFNNQHTLSSTKYQEIAEQLELDKSKFDNCLNNKIHLKEVQKDFDYGLSVGVSKTPTFFINGIKLIGAQPYKTFQQVIESELNQ